MQLEHEHHPRTCKPAIACLYTSLELPHAVIACRDYYILSPLNIGLVLLKHITRSGTACKGLQGGPVHSRKSPRLSQHNSSPEPVHAFKLLEKEWRLHHHAIMTCHSYFVTGTGSSSGPKANLNRTQKKRLQALVASWLPAATPNKHFFSCTALMFVGSSSMASRMIIEKHMFLF